MNDNCTDEAYGAHVIGCANRITKTNKERPVSHKASPANDEQ